MKRRFPLCLFLAALVVLAQFAQAVPSANAIESVSLVPYTVTLTNLQKGTVTSSYVITNLGSANATTVHEFFSSEGTSAGIYGPALIPAGGQLRVYLGTLTFLPTPGVYTVKVSSDQPISGEIIQPYSMAGLLVLINSLPSDALSPQLVNSLVHKMDAARNQAARENICPAVNILGAFQNEVEAQRGKGISDAAATRLVDYATHLITQLLANLPNSRRC